MILNVDELLSELTFKAVRSSGAGGQHVNKVSSKVILFFNIAESEILTDEQKETLITNLSPKLTKAQILILSCDESRSQHKNKEIVIERFLGIIAEGLKVRKKRMATKTPKAVKQKRLDEKRKQSQIKANRKKPDLD